MREEEYKVDLSHLDPPSVQGLVTEAVAELGLYWEKRGERSQISQYFDSENRMLSRLGVGLRFRSLVEEGLPSHGGAHLLTIGRWCLKLPTLSPQTAESVVRDEFEIDGTGSGPPRQFFLALDYALEGFRSLQTIALLRTERSSMVVGRSQEELQAAVDVDRVTVVDPQPSHFLEVEIEALQPTMSESATRLFQRLIDRGGQAHRVSKLGRALSGGRIIETDAEHLGDPQYLRLLGLRIRLAVALSSITVESAWHCGEMVARLMLKDPHRWTPTPALTVLLGKALVLSVLSETKALGVDGPLSGDDGERLMVKLCSAVVEFEESGRNQNIVGDLVDRWTRVTSLGNARELCRVVLAEREFPEPLRDVVEHFLRAAFEVG
jgi:hypothetical protein